MKSIQELNSINDELNFKNIITCQDHIFEKFINNQIDVDDLDYLYKKRNLVLSEEFYHLSRDKQKKYRQHIRTDIVINENVEYYTYSIFNKVYFYDLIEASKKNKHITSILVQYLNDLHNIPLYIIGMQNIRINNIVIKATLKEYASNKGINTLYDLYMDIKTNHPFKLPNENILKTIDSVFISHSPENKNLEIDMSYFFNEFSFMIEQYLYKYYERKIANTIKLKFIVYKKDYLRDKDYIKTKKNGIDLLKKHFNDSEHKYTLKQLKKYFKEHYKDISNLPPNGYTAIYYAIEQLEEDK